MDRLFLPKTIAVFGASEKPDSVGYQVFANLRQGGFQGSVYPINPRYESLQGLPCFPSIEALGKAVDLAVVVTPAKTVAEILRSCGEQGVGSAIVLSAGFAEIGEEGERRQAEVVDVVRRFGIRMIGPNCLGLMRPSIGMNATFSQGIAAQGSIALISQSGAICTSVLDWAKSRGIGFSAMVSLGVAADIGFGEALEYLAMEKETQSILLYVEGIREARRFLSSLRVAARLKPVIVLKAGRHAEGARAAKSHTGALVGADDVFDAALERAGAVRVRSIGQLFSAAQILASGYRVEGRRLAIVSNAGGPGVMATDRAIDVGVELPTFAEATLRGLDAALPPQWSHGNPVDILGDATPQRYRDAVSLCLADPQVDGVLAMLTPQAMTSPTQAALAVLEAAATSSKPLLACWMGAEQIEEGRRLFEQKAIPTFSTPEDAVEAFSYLAEYHRNQIQLLETPAPLLPSEIPDVEGARLIIEGALAEGRSLLHLTEAKAVLRAFHIPVVMGIEARTASEALVAAETLGFPVAMKIMSPDIVHKSDVGGVVLGIAEASAIRSAFHKITSHVQKRLPQAKITGVLVEAMAHPAHKREVMVGAIRDAAFGPIVSFGLGGTAVEIFRDRAVALPPLSSFLIRQMIKKTKAARLLQAFRDLPPIQMDALEAVLLRLSAMVCELPHLQEIEINPLFVNEEGALAVDIRILVENPPLSTRPYDHMAIHPYPSYLASSWQSPDGRDVSLRPIRPEDAALLHASVESLSLSSLPSLLLPSESEVSSNELFLRMTQTDYDREMVFLAVTSEDCALSRSCIGVARYAVLPDAQTASFAVLVAEDWQKQGLGARLLQALLDAARYKQLRFLQAEIPADSKKLLPIARQLGFVVSPPLSGSSTLLIRRPL